MIRINIDKVLLKKNKTAFWLSKECKISYNNLSKLIKNETEGIKFNMLNNICNILDCELTDIIEYKKD